MLYVWSGKERRKRKTKKAQDGAWVTKVKLQTPGWINPGHTTPAQFVLGVRRNLSDSHARARTHWQILYGNGQD